MKISITTFIKCFLLNVHVNNIQMVYYDIISVSEGTDVNKTSALKEYIICRIWYCLRFFKLE